MLSVLLPLLFLCTAANAVLGNENTRARDPKRLLSPTFRLTLSTACARDVVPSGTDVSLEYLSKEEDGRGSSEIDDSRLFPRVRLVFPNGTVAWRDSCWTSDERSVLRARHVREVKESEENKQTTSLRGNGPPNQWLAWMFASLPVWQNGGTFLQNTWIVPPLPKARSNLALFNGFQPTYDPKSYDYIVQPCLLHGEWLMSSHAGWGGQAVTCIPAAGRCVQSESFSTSPGHLLVGTVKLVSGAGTSRMTFNITIADLNSMTTPVSVTYTTKYMATMAFVGVLEHNPLGPLSSCDQLPTGSVTFGCVHFVCGCIWANRRWRETLFVLWAVRLVFGLLFYADFLFFFYFLFQEYHLQAGIYAATLGRPRWRCVVWHLRSDFPVGGCRHHHVLSE
jgi:hypothetical protein